eukprot:3652637-Pyramimonas_sp.AAC.1
MPGAGANRARVESICPEKEPITRGGRAYARSGSQSREGGEHMPGAGANRARVGCCGGGHARTHPRDG